MTEGATISGHVVRDGKPAAGEVVEIVHENHRSGDWLGKFEIGTNDAGLFVMTNLGPNEAYVVKVANDSKTVKVDADKSVTDAGTFETH
jgi:hypothetical protein